MRFSRILAVLFVAAALAHGLRQDVPVGGLRGSVFARDSKRVLAGTRITLTPVVKSADDDEETDGPRTRYTTSGKDGAFSITHLPAGDYHLSAVTRAHSVSGVLVSVAEGSATQTVIALDRSEQPLQIKLHQRVFGSGESPHLSVTGYADENVRRGDDRMMVRIWKTRLSSVLTNPDSAGDLDKVGADFDPIPSLPADLLRPARGPAPVPVATVRVPIADDAEGFFYQTLDFAKMGLTGITPGLYLMDVTHLGASGCAWMLVTDTALVIKRSNSKVLGFAVDMRTGAPAPNGIIRAYKRGQVLAETRSGTDGVGMLDVPKDVAEQSDGDGQRVTFVALRGDDEAVVNDSYFRNERDDAFTVCTYTDRPIYRPGQRIYFKTIARRTAAGPADTQSRYSVPAGQSANVELRDPTGELVYRGKLTTNRFGALSGSADLNPEAPTGVYTLKTTFDGVPHTHDIVIASYRKPEFAVTVTPDKKRYGQHETVRMTISALYYFGAPVAGAKVKYHVSSSPDWSSEYDTDSSDEDTGEPFSEPGVGRRHEYYGASVVEGETRLGANGKAVVTFSTESPDRPKFMRAAENYTLSATVTEGEDREAEADGVALVTPGDFKLLATPQGYVAAPGQPTAFALVAKDYDNKPVPSVAVEVEVGYQTWTRSNLLFKRTELQNVTLGPDGRFQLSVTPQRAGDMVVKLRGYDSQRRLIVGRGSLYVAADGGGDLDTEYADLAILTDKRKYSAGGTARVVVNAQRTGETVLLTIEGERLYHQQTVPMDRKTRVIYVPVKREFGPNAFISACYVRDKHIAQSSASLRVATPQQELHVEVTADRRADRLPLPRYGPGDKITYRVRTTDAAGRPAPAELSLGVVDESIYALKEDDPTALRDAFYPRRSNLVSTEYSFAIQYLGDADKSEPKITARKKFPDTACWNPSLTTGADGLATVSFALPDSLTTWRATVTAATADTKLGRAVCKVISAKDFLVRLQTPRFLTQRDQSEVVAYVHNNTGAPQTAVVKLEAGNLTVTGETSRTIGLSVGQIGDVHFPVTAASYGAAKLTLKAWTARSPGAPQFTDGLETSLPIRPHGREDVQAFGGELTAAHSESEVVRLDPAAVPGRSRLTVKITPSIASSLFGATDYLVGYPYGCTEQTMSRFLPDLLVERALKQQGMPAPASAPELPQMVRNGLQRLYRFQHADSGAWGWWEHDADSPWMTAYVLYGLSTARAQGIAVSDNVLAKARKAAAKMAGSVNTDLSDRAFLIYSLALAGDTATARAERARPIPLAKFRTDALAYMALVDRQLGSRDEALVAELSRRAVDADGGIHWKPGAGAADWSDVSTTALCLRAVLAVNPQDARIGRILAWLMRKRSGDYWYSTRDTSATLAAFCDYVNAVGQTAETGDVRVKVNGALFQTVTLTPAMLKEKEITLRVPPSSLRPDKNDVTLERTGGNSGVFYSVELRQTIATEDLAQVANPNLSV
ncbi:MAG TPA: alpha-2-macroglobulin family protein, partial [Chthonomonadaceae bacterium]|nr:alpha-2-macroglobulin family protein [Chthonomonadaceae bacterium]